MKVGLFVPCYVDQMYPEVAWAAWRVLTHCGIDVDFPAAQTCCGQPMANTGCVDQTAPLAKQFVKIFRPYDYVVSPSGSCIAMVRHHYAEFFENSADYRYVSERSYELCEFLHDVLDLKELPGQFPHRVGIHQSCHGLRELRLGSSSELVKPAFSKVEKLLSLIDGIEFTALQRPDECCGFGGTFAVAEEAVSVMMGDDRIADHEQAGTEVLTGADMSCLMHLDGLLRRRKSPMRVLHVAQILAGDDGKALFS
ncbi:MAG: (Fe-S)-binding protein [Planctomycetota bacterium]|nr:(Fe-S)-binding protein [Planctomycetota bacterium]MDA1214058.1 (Fe-S)-binding protein [Planctomycetota bacterium]